MRIVGKASSDALGRMAANRQMQDFRRQIRTDGGEADDGLTARFDMTRDLKPHLSQMLSGFLRPGVIAHDCNGKHPPRLPPSTRGDKIVSF